MEAIYGDDPPNTSRAQVQICISALRRMFATHAGPEVIVTRPHGYAIQVNPEQIDAHHFEKLVVKARRAREGDNVEEAIRHYREALSLWRGSALDGIDSRVVQSAAGLLNERRISANEDCVDLELGLGRHHEVVGELTGLVEEHPLRERLRGQLMLALYRSGRQAEALRVYRDGRTMMIEELGIEPNERLQQLEYAILTSAESLDVPEKESQSAPQPAPPAPTPGVPNVPAMLPTDIADFTGRTQEVEQIRRMLTGYDSVRLAVPIIVIGGKAGVGKTTIAVHVAHLLAESFEGGQLFADLHGGIARPVSPMQVLGRFLRVLGVPGNALPEELEERAEMYRSLIADRQMLIVLDDAESESQIQPLLPGNPASCVIVTSRSRLTGLAGATHLDVGVFGSPEAVDLLARIAGSERVLSEAEHATALAELCGQLPLALRIAGARLSARPHWSVEQLADRLQDETRRLDELQHGEMGIRASISLTYDGISEEARRLFRRLAILDTLVFSAWISAALLNKPLEDAQDLLDDLADAQLVEITGRGHGVHAQYRLHDLIRVFARERLAAEEPAAERSAALTRVLGALLALTDAARLQEYGLDLRVLDSSQYWSLPGKLVQKLVAQPIQWFERERPTIVSAIRQAAQAGFVELCWGLAVTAEQFFESRVYLDDWREIHEVALEVTRQARDKRGQAAARYSIGALAITEQRFVDARRNFRLALEHSREVGDDLWTARVLHNLGLLDRLNGRIEDASNHYEEALAIFRSSGHEGELAYVLHSLAQLRLDCEDIDGAKLLLAEALVRSNAHGGRRVRAQVLYRIGMTHLRAEEYVVAAEAFEQSLNAARTISDPVGEAYSLIGLGVSHLRRGALGESETVLRRALAVADTYNQRLAKAQVLSSLGELALADGDPRQAVVIFQQAATLFRKMQMPFYEAKTLVLVQNAVLSTDDEQAGEEARSRVQELMRGLDTALAKQLQEQLDAARARELDKS
ncbi:Tetratricopeptide repeat-containing protein [Nonomuraea jiangxiensis]|uniref:Tetratricopeptide repeat-containing protein n=2 Tax=Nonomuraea jiangxiensis TaxID=633440 RepID=A0A1G8II49_9ACTN|nr:Tetratricopeptide repeat-containing protein [Nonomuraea jiangxiensis]